MWSPGLPACIRIPKQLAVGGVTVDFMALVGYAVYGYTALVFEFCCFGTLIVRVFSCKKNFGAEFLHEYENHTEMAKKISAKKWLTIFYNCEVDYWFSYFGYSTAGGLNLIIVYNVFYRKHMITHLFVVLIHQTFTLKNTIFSFSASNTEIKILSKKSLKI